MLKVALNDIADKYCSIASSFWCSVQQCRPMYLLIIHSMSVWPRKIKGLLRVMTDARQISVKKNNIPVHLQMEKCNFHYRILWKCRRIFAIYFWQLL